MREALLAGRFDEIVGLLAGEWEAREARRRGTLRAEIERIAGTVRAAGGAARVCGGGSRAGRRGVGPPGARGPGRREAVAAALKAAGLRLFPARVDLRGLDVE